MERFIARRIQDTRFTNERRVSGGESGTRLHWYNESARIGRVLMDSTTHGGVVRTRLTFAKEEAEKAKKTEKAEKSTSSSSSESDGEGGRHKKKKKTKGNAPGYDGPDKCWDGYKRVPDKMRGEPGSCVKA